LLFEGSYMISSTKPFDQVAKIKPLVLNLLPAMVLKDVFLKALIGIKDSLVSADRAAELAIGIF
jgi:hypothetical protein